MAMTANYSIHNGVLTVSGSLDRAADPDFAAALEHYGQQVPLDKRAVDMSQVRWLAPTGAKLLIQFAQDMQDRGTKLRVACSRHVYQTLNLLGAKSWLTMDVQQGAQPASPFGPGASSASPSASGPRTPAVAAHAPAAAAPAASGTPAGFASGEMSLDSSFDAGDFAAAHATDSAVPSIPASHLPPHADIANSPRTVPATKPATSSGMLAAVRLATLAGVNEDLVGGAHLLRQLQPGRRYAFHFAGLTVTGIVRDRVGGPWVVVDVDGVKKYVNVEVVAVCEPLLG